MRDEDFIQLGFKGGLEIHHQLDTTHKLFCRCPVGLRNEQPHAQILRHMRPTLSEFGEYDGTALMEFKTKKQVVYQLFRDSVCTYEMDDTPPFSVNREALEIAIEIAMLLNCSIVDEIHISRKQYLDGSIPTGFQRTAIVGVNGWIPYKGRKIGITHVTVEEDACREVSDIGHTIVFKADRLSTPLVEVITAADMKTPKELEEVDELLGTVIRATNKVRRGIGSVRQDVNVSIAGGTRIEIKGVAKTKYIAKLAANEAIRQKNLLELRKEVAKREIIKNCERKDITDLLGKMRCSILQQALKKGARIKAICLKNYSGIFNFPTQPGISFSQEVSGRIRVIACLDSKPNTLHSDGPDLYEITIDDWRLIRNEFSAAEDDLIVIVWGSEEDTNTALTEIEIRCINDIIQVPSETRQAFSNGTTDFERILPGPDRMYPDTDSPPIALSKTLLEKISDNLPELPWHRERRYLKMGLSCHIAKELVVYRYAMLFDKIVSHLKINPTLVAVSLLETLKYLKRKGENTKILSEEYLYEIFAVFKGQNLTQQKMKKLLELACETGKSPDALFKELELRSITNDNIKKLIKEVIRENKEFDAHTDGKYFRFLMGKIMKKLNGEAEGNKVSLILKNSLNYSK